MARKRIHILTAVNAANVSKSGGTYTIKDVCGAVDGLVMNSMLYPGEQLANAAASLEDRPAPAGHPKNAAGQYISATSGDALLSAFVGAICRNARHEGGRTLVDVVVNEAQAKAHPDGVRLVERLDAAITGNNADPIHVSTGLYCEAIQANGESGGKAYSRIATGIKYDHLAILLNEQGAGTPADGVGMWLNSEGQPEEVEQATLQVHAEDKRSAGLKAWVMRLIGNGSSDMSFEAIQSGLHALLPEGAWLSQVFDRHAIWTDKDGRFWRQDYTVSSDGSLAFAGQVKEVRREVTYEEVDPITNLEEDPVKEQILAVLNAAGISTAGLDEAQLLAAYNAHVAKPHKDALTAANSKLAEFEANAKKEEAAKVDALAAQLAVNSSLTVEDFKALGLKRLEELAAKAAPVLTGNAGGAGGADPYADYPDNPGFDPKEGKQ